MLHVNRPSPAAGRLEVILQEVRVESSVVTFLFTDLVQSTEHLVQAGDERGKSLFSAHHKQMNQAVTANGGEELEWLGDGILAAFSSASDAVRCAIKVQQTARRPAAGVHFKIRIGIHAGEAARRGSGYFGTPLVTARRLCDRAEPGQILCSKMIQSILATRRGFDFRELGPLQLKGLTAPISTVEVVYESNDAAALLNRTPFVGRAAQIQRLAAKLEQSGNGHGAVVMLVGEPGIGKTRMLEEFTDLAHEQGTMVLRGACYDGEYQRPYGPFAEVLVEYARKADPDELKLFNRSAPLLARIAPALREHLKDIPEPVALDKEDERFRLFDALSQFLIGVSQQRPLVVLLDDLHWADRGTVAMLGHVAHFVPANAILLIGAYRDAEVDRNHPLMGAVASIRRLRNSETLKLAGLSGDELAILLEMVGDQDAPGALVKALRDATEGNPLFIREVLLHLLEEGKILSAGQGWISRLSVEELGIPEGIRQVIGSRLTKLSEDANQLLSVAAAFNGAFSFQVAAAVAELDEEAALSAIDEALEAQLLRPGANSDAFDFTHALIRHTLYEGLNPVRRVRLHRRIAEQMESASGERAVDHAAEVAYQFWRSATASGAERGVDYALAAANNAEAAFDHDEVAAFLRIALKLISPSDERRAALLSRLSFALAWSLNDDEALATAREAGALMTMAGNDGAADFYEQTARTMLSAGCKRAAWEMAAEGLKHIGDRRDLTWASLAELQSFRREAADPDNPGIRIDSVENRELYSVLKRLPREQLETRYFETPFASRDEIVRDPAPQPRVLLMLAGDFRRSLPMQQVEAAEDEQHGAIHAHPRHGWFDIVEVEDGAGLFDTQVVPVIDRPHHVEYRRPAPGLRHDDLIAHVRRPRPEGRGVLRYRTRVPEHQCVGAVLQRECSHRRSFRD